MKDETGGADVDVVRVGSVRLAEGGVRLEGTRERPINFTKNVR